MFFLIYRPYGKILKFSLAALGKESDTAAVMVQIK